MIYSSVSYIYRTEGGGEMIHLSELQSKEIVLLSSGKRLGFIDDLEINEKTGEIIAIIVIGRQDKMSFFAKPTELKITWDQIATIGTDIILIKEEKSVEKIKNMEK